MAHATVSRSARRRAPSSPAGRVQLLTDIVAEIGVENLHHVGIWARIGNRPGRFHDSGTSIDIVADGEGDSPAGSTQTPEELVDMLLEEGRKYEEDVGGRCFFQARLVQRDDEGAEGKTTLATFGTFEDEGVASETYGEQVATISSLNRTVRLMEKTIGNTLDHLEKMANIANMGVRTDAEVARVGLERYKVEQEFKRDDMMWDMANQRLSEITKPMGEGIRDNISQEPTTNTLSKEMREFLEKLGDDRLDSLIAVLPDEVAAVINAATAVENNAEYRAVIEKGGRILAAMDKAKQQKLMMDIAGAIGVENARRLGSLLSAGGA
jgi:hypothetical protein